METATTAAQAIAIAAQASAMSGEATAIQAEVTKNHAARQEENAKNFLLCGKFPQVIVRQQLAQSSRVEQKVCRLARGANPSKQSRASSASRLRSRSTVPMASPIAADGVVFIYV
jgi:hypothetical protein